MKKLDSSFLDFGLLYNHLLPLILSAGPHYCTGSPDLFSCYLTCPRAMLQLQQSVTALPSLLVGWDHYYWLADGPAGQGWRVYLWLCVGAVVCIPCHALCPGMLPGPDLVSDEPTVAGTGMTGWDSGTQASLRVRRKSEDGLRGIENMHGNVCMYKWLH